LFVSSPALRKCDSGRVSRNYSHLDPPLSNWSRPMLSFEIALVID
jgi:hypothetical protein